MEEQAELDRLAKQRAEEKLLRTALSTLSTEELRAMQEHLGREGREEWTEEDEPLMLRLLELKEEARREEAEGDFPWRAAMRKQEGGT